MASIDRRVTTSAAYRAVVRGWPDRALLACSGGIDSSALLVLAGTAVQHGELPPFVVAHVDHRTRPGSASEGEVVEELARRFGLPVLRTAVDDADNADSAESPEARLRRLRYSALARVAHECSAASVVTAHTRDDQVETILMRLVTGAGGLAATGMTARVSLRTENGTIVVVRPLLDVSRRDLQELLELAGVEPGADPTNHDPAYRRNAIRHSVIPHLRNAFPGFEQALIRSVDLAARDAEALDAIVESEMMRNDVVDRQQHGLRRGWVNEVHPALASRAIRQMVRSLIPGDCRELTFERIESVRVAAAGRTGAIIQLPYGIDALVERHLIVFSKRNG